MSSIAFGGIVINNNLITMLYSKNTRLAYFALVILMCSCSTEQQCVDGSVFFQFVSFSDVQTDSIVIKKFAKDALFDTIIDSITISKQNSTYQKSNDTLNVVNNMSGGVYAVETAYDYEVYMPNANKRFRITDITSQQTERRIAAFYYKSGQCINPVKSYILDGQVISGSYGIIYLIN